MSSVSSHSSEAGGHGTTAPGKDYGGLDFKIIWDAKAGPAVTIHLIAPTIQGKWRPIH